MCACGKVTFIVKILFSKHSYSYQLGVSRYIYWYYKKHCHLQVYIPHGKYEVYIKSVFLQHSAVKFTVIQIYK